MAQLIVLAGEDALLESDLLLLDVVLLALRVEVEEVEDVFHQLKFESVVELAVGGQAGRMIHLDKPRFQFSIKHNIKPQNLKAKFIFIVIWLA